MIFDTNSLQQQAFLSELSTRICNALMYYLLIRCESKNTLLIGLKNHINFEIFLGDIFNSYRI